MKKMSGKTAFLCRAALIAACYVVLSFFTYGFNSGAIQLRLSEALCVLAIFTPAAIPGMTVGCVVANLLSGGALWDMVFGSLATLVGVAGTYLLRKLPWLAPLPYVLANTFVVPAVLIKVYGADDAYFLLVLSIGVSELITAYILGLVLYFVLEKSGARKFIG